MAAADASPIATLPLHELAAFEAVARLGSFVQAADELCVTHSAVSHRVRQLERKLGRPLFIRRGRSMMLLPEGEAHLGIVVQALSLLRSAGEHIDRLEMSFVRIAVAPALGAGWLVPRIAAFRQRRPDARFEITTVAAIDDAVDCDLLLHYTVGAPRDEARPRLFADDIRPVCAPSLMQRFGPFDRLPRYLAVPLLRHPLLSWPAWIASAFGETADPFTAFYFDDAVSMLAAAAGGLGIALSTRVACEALIERGELVHAHEHSLHAADYGVLLSESGQAKAAAREFAAWLSATVTQERS